MVESSEATIFHEGCAINRGEARDLEPDRLAEAVTLNTCRPTASFGNGNSHETIGPPRLSGRSGCRSKKLWRVYVELATFAGHAILEFGKDPGVGTC